MLTERFGYGFTKALMQNINVHSVTADSINLFLKLDCAVVMSIVPNDINQVTVTKQKILASSFFSVRILSFVFFIPATTSNGLQLRKISIPDLIYYIIFLS